MLRRRPYRTALSGLLLTLVLWAGDAFGGDAVRVAQLSAVVGSGTTEAAAGEAVTLPDNLTPAERADLLARLSDSQVRALLLDQLAKADAAAGPQTAETGMIGGVDAETERLRSRLDDVLSTWPGLAGIVPFFVDRVTPDDWGASFLFVLLAGFALVFAAAAAAEWLFRRFSASVRSQIETAMPVQLIAKCGYQMLRFGLDALALIVFQVVAIGTFFAMYHGHEPVRLTVLTYIGAVVVVRWTSLITRFLLAPAAPALRLLPLDDSAARKLHREIVCLAAIGAVLMLTSSLLQSLMLEQNLASLVGMIAGTLFTIAIIVTIWRIRAPVAGLIYDGASENAAGGRVRQIFGQSWHVLASFYVVAIATMATVSALLDQVSTTTPGVVSLLIVIAVPLLDAAIGKAIEDSGKAGPNSFKLAIRRGVRLLIILVAIMIFARIWGFDVFDIAAQGVGEQVSRAVLDIGFTLLLAYIGWEVLRSAIDRYIEEEDVVPDGESGGEGGGTGASRLRTLMPLFRNALFATLCVMVTMIVLSSLGVDIGPLIAGAGVIGLAIGFGAQTLVRDIVSGVFFLIDDAFRIGEYIDLGDVKGTVENISIRSMRLRHHRGPVHTVPFGEIHFLTNYSRDWTIVKLDFRVTYDTSLKQVKNVFKQINEELAADPEMGPNLLEPLKSQGVKAMEDSAMIIRAKFTAKPGQQFLIRRAVYMRVQQLFREQGIEFAHRRVAVEIPKGAENDPKALADAAAAASAAEAEGKATA